jgi:hypothetical protein
MAKELSAMTASIQADHARVVAEAREALPAIKSFVQASRGFHLPVPLLEVLRGPRARLLHDSAKLASRWRGGELLSETLEAAVSDFGDYKAQGVTLTRRTYHDHQDPRLYASLVHDTQQLMSRELKRGFLSGPGTGAVTAFHLQDNVHAHLLYWGPPPKDTAAEWLRATTDSDQVNVQPLPGVDDVAQLAAYMMRLPPQIESTPLVLRDHALGRTRLVERYGVYRRQKNG